MKERGGPGKLPQVRDVKGRKDLLIERGRSGAQNSLRYQVTYHAYLASGERLSYTPSIERVVD